MIRYATIGTNFVVNWFWRRLRNAKGCTIVQRIPEMWKRPGNMRPSGERTVIRTP